MEIMDMMFDVLRSEAGEWHAAEVVGKFRPLLWMESR